ncbi:hypothetical protein M885DRAFT_515525 [Pelagophyceae sp. CCMP2097]|nr:hypothetical protein M885DRAFT_515525 [Pelagophyceae sp. CCMP2097]
MRGAAQAPGPTPAKRRSWFPGRNNATPSPPPQLVFGADPFQGADAPQSLDAFYSLLELVCAGKDRVGLFRVAAAGGDVSAVLMRIDAGESVLEAFSSEVLDSEETADVAASLVKSWVRKRFQRLVPQGARTSLLRCAAGEGGLSAALLEMSQPLSHLLKALSTVSANASVNKMDASNLAIVFAPNIFEMDDAMALEQLRPSIALLEEMIYAVASGPFRPSEADESQTVYAAQERRASSMLSRANVHRPSMRRSMVPRNAADADRVAANNDRVAADRVALERAASTRSADGDGGSWDGAAALSAWQDREAISAWDRDRRGLADFDGEDEFTDHELSAYNAMFAPANASTDTDRRRESGARTSGNSDVSARQRSDEALARHGESTLKMALSSASLSPRTAPSPAAAAFSPASAVPREPSARAAKGHFSSEPRFSRKNSEPRTSRRTDSYAALKGYVPPRNEEAVRKDDLDAARLRSVVPLFDAAPSPDAGSPSSRPACNTSRR